MNSLKTFDSFIEDNTPAGLEGADDLIMYMSYANYNLFVAKIADVGGRYVDPGTFGTKNNKIMYKRGSQVVRIEALDGLFGLNTIYYTSLKNLVFVNYLPSMMTDVVFEYDSKRLAADRALFAGK